MISHEKRLRAGAEEAGVVASRASARSARRTIMTPTVRGQVLLRRQVLAGAAAAGIDLAAPAAVRAQPQALKIAVLLPRSGYLAQAGQSCHRGALVAAKVLADFDYKVDLVHADIESNPDTARALAERVINEGAQCVVGAFDSASTLAIAQVCEQRQTPLVVNIGSAPQLTEQGYQFLVRNFPTSAIMLSNGLARINDLIAATHIRPRTAIFIHANDNFGTAQRQAMDKLVPIAGLPFRLVKSISFDPRAQDLAAEVTKIRGHNPDVVLAVTRAADAIKLVRDMVRQHFQPMALISPGARGLFDEEFYQALGPLADFHVDVLPWSKHNAGLTQALAAAFKVEQPNFRFVVECFNVGFTFEALLIAADAFRRTASANGRELMAALKSTDIANHVMIGPAIRFDPKGQNIGIPSACIQNRHRTPTVVLPAEVATLEPVLPEPPWLGRS
jgi:branched-chain amino acid transport system substrate-binding protein